MKISKLGCLLTITCSACNCDPEHQYPAAKADQIAVTELASSNPGGGPGAARDEVGDYDDWIELHNLTDQTLDLSGLYVSDTVANPQRYQLPLDIEIPIAPGAYLLLFADGETHQGPLHLPFSLDKDGEGLAVLVSTGDSVTSMSFPELAVGESFASVDSTFVICRTPSPGRENGCSDEPPPRKTYEPYEWASPWPPALTAKVVISELDLYAVSTATPSVELWNDSAEAVDLRC